MISKLVMSYIIYKLMTSVISRITFPALARTARGDTPRISPIGWWYQQISYQLNHPAADNSCYQTYHLSC